MANASAKPVRPFSFQTEERALERKPPPLLYMDVESRQPEEVVDTKQELGCKEECSGDDGTVQEMMIMIEKGNRNRHPAEVVAFET